MDSQNQNPQPAATPQKVPNNDGQLGPKTPTPASSQQDPILEGRRKSRHVISKIIVGVVSFFIGGFICTFAIGAIGIALLPPEKYAESGILIGAIATLGFPVGGAMSTVIALVLWNKHLSKRSK